LQEARRLPFDLPSNSQPLISQRDVRSFPVIQLGYKTPIKPTPEK